AIPAVDAARLMTAAWKRARVRTVVALGALAMTTLVTVPSIVDIVQFSHWNSSNYRVVVPGEKALVAGATGAGADADVSGLIMNKPVAEAIESKAHALSRLPKTDPFIFLTPHSYLIPKIARVYPELPVGDLVGESVSRGDYDRLLNHIMASRARQIY